MTARSAADVLGCIWAGVIAVANVYRGITQSVTTDEAFAYQLFVNQKFRDLFVRFDAAYHVLHTWLTWIAVHLLGKSEAILRLPSMVCGVWYLVGCFKLSQRILPAGWSRLAALVLLTAHPLIFDYLSAARGYGAALACFAWALVALLDGNALWGAALLALSTSCNLTFFLPSVSLGVTFLLVERLCNGRSLKRSVGMAGVFLGISGLILALPLRLASKQHFYFGSDDWRTSLDTLILCSFRYHDRIGYDWAAFAGKHLVPGAAVTLLVAGGFALRRKGVLPLLATGALAVTVLLQTLAHHLGGVPYPWTRTGLAVIWLSLLALAAHWGWLPRQAGRIRWLAWMVGSVCVLSAGLFVAQLDVRYYYDFRDDAEVSGFMRRVATMRKGERDCVGGSWRYEPTVNYYRLRYRIAWLDTMQRTPEPCAGCRFYLLRREDLPYQEKLGLKIIERGEVSGAILAVAE